MKSLLALSAIALLSVGVAACDDAGKGTGSASRVTPAAAVDTSATTIEDQTKDSNDLDEDPTSNDDSVVVDYGHAATAADTRAITAAVKRYYTAAAAGDGTRACSMLVSTVAEGVPEEYGHAPGRAPLRGTTCAVVMSKLLKDGHHQIAADLATLEVTRVRVEEGTALVVLRFTTTPEPRKIALRREGGIWKIKDLLDSGMP